MTLLIISLGVLALGGIKGVSREGKVYLKRIKVCIGWLQVYIPDLSDTASAQQKNRKNKESPTILELIKLELRLSRFQMKMFTGKCAYITINKDD